MSDNDATRARRPAGVMKTASSSTKWFTKTVAAPLRSNPRPMNPAYRATKPVAPRMKRSARPKSAQGVQKQRVLFAHKGPGAEDLGRNVRDDLAGQSDPRLMTDLPGGLRHAARKTQLRGGYYLHDGVPRSIDDDGQSDLDGYVLRADILSRPHNTVIACWNTDNRAQSHQPICLGFPCQGRVRERLCVHAWTHLFGLRGKPRSS